MTMFGRDSILTSLQALPFTSELAATTLRALGDWQGIGVDDFRDEDPGRILHEMRYGELTAFEERPHSPYYGSADATPLFVVLLDEYERWTGDRALVRELEVESRAALNWIDEYADLQGNGYVWYERRNKKTGLENQCWKDSWDSISFRDGRIPGFPRATCELQGYAYDAKRPRCPPGTARLEGHGPGGEARTGSGRPQAPLQPGLLGRGRRVLRPRARPRGPAGGRAHLEQRPSPLERHRRQVQGEGRRRAPARAAALFRLGRPHPGRGRRALQPDRLPRWHGLALRQLVHRLGPAAVRVQGRSCRGRGGHPGRCRVLRGAPAGGVRRLRALPDAVSGAVPDGVQPAGLVHRCAALASCGRCWASSRRGSTWWSTRRSQAPSATSSCSTFPDGGAGSTPSDEGESTWKAKGSERELGRGCRAPARLCAQADPAPRARAVHLQLRGLEHERDDRRHQRRPGHDRQGRPNRDHPLPADHGDPDDPLQQADRPLGSQALLHRGPDDLRDRRPRQRRLSESRRPDPRQLGAGGRWHSALDPARLHPRDTVVQRHDEARLGFRRDQRSGRDRRCCRTADRRRDHDGDQLAGGVRLSGPGGRDDRAPEPPPGRSAPARSDATLRRGRGSAVGGRDVLRRVRDPPGRQQQHPAGGLPRDRSRLPARVLPLHPCA